MLIAIVLLWVCMNLNAPIWCTVFCWITIIVDALSVILKSYYDN